MQLQTVRTPRWLRDPGFICLSQPWGRRQSDAQHRPGTPLKQDCVAKMTGPPGPWSCPVAPPGAGTQVAPGGWRFMQASRGHSLYLGLRTCCPLCLEHSHALANSFSFSETQLQLCLLQEAFLDSVFHPLGCPFGSLCSYPDTVTVYISG